MDYITADQLSIPSEAIWDRVEAGEEFIVTRAGQPIALLVRTDTEAMPEQLRALRLIRLGDLVRCIQAEAMTSGADQITDEEIQAEIDAARREAAVKAAIAAKAGRSRSSDC
jgi:antitoxin (DNA-binding transcriptional repressor) of toxin-antitoxin stability system